MTSSNFTDTSAQLALWGTVYEVTTEHSKAQCNFEACALHLGLPPIRLGLSARTPPAFGGPWPALYRHEKLYRHP